MKEIHVFIYLKERTTFLLFVLSKFGKTIRVSHVTKKDNGQIWKIVKDCSRYMVFPSAQKEGRGGGMPGKGSGVVLRPKYL